MRRYALLCPLATLLLAAPAGAQHWNDAGPGRDLLSATGSEFEALRQRLPAAPSFSATGVAPLGAQARDPIPMLDWTPQPAPAPAARPRTAPRRVARPRPDSVMRDPVMRDPGSLAAAGLPPLNAAPRAQPISQTEWERSFAERERELARLRALLEQDRLRFDQARQPQLR